MSNPNAMDDQLSESSLTQLRIVLDKPRTVSFGITNQSTDFILKLVLANGVDEAHNPPPQGYQNNTGVTVVGTEVYPTQVRVTAIQPQINVLASRAKCSIHWKRNVSPYDEGDLNLGDLVAPAGKYLPTPSWTVIDRPRKDGNKELHLLNEPVELVL